MRSGTLSIIAAICVLAVAAFTPSDTAAATNAPPTTAPANLEGMSVEEAESRRRILFQRMLVRPDDLDTAFAYATLSVRIGDLEGAIATLERMLIFAPGLPRLQLEIGLLYHRLNANLTALTYLRAAVSGNAPQAVRVRVDAIIARIEAAEERDVFHAELRSGLRYQTNANRAPGSPDILLNGRRFRLQDASTGQDDVNAFIAGSLHYAKDLEGQGDTFDIDVVGYGAQQFDQTQLDLLTAEVTVGPSFDLGRYDIDNAKLGVFAILSGVVLGDDVSATAYGIGTRYVAQVRPDLGLVLKAEYRRRNYRNTDASPNASLKDGDEYRLGALVNRIISPSQLLTLGLAWQYTDAEAGFDTYGQGTAFVNYRHAFDSPVAALTRDWIASLGGGLVTRRYADPDPLVDVTREQSVQEYFLRAGLEIPLEREGWALGGDTEYRNATSNYDLSDHDNLAVSLYVKKRW